MFGLLENLTKAAVAVAVTPVAAAVDVLAIPADAYDGKDMFSRTGAMLRAAGENLSEAVKPDGK
ncbi:hypothetical protein AZ34_11905 [Hylemonella gracilis str. Niagara R]|uniref:Uncharacterized protein n=1 Tax=Hylemonella gracilis str. Niagara R TaxID=1458275 RepID=A0A016XKG1_9BURK|nr:hypothetical protein [Hylemonella gracilis]EYC51708.1 hypothetical protein AZ34_11905 [Hylemonella gracilis str. Niagara R]